MPSLNHLNKTALTLALSQAIAVIVMPLHAATIIVNSTSDTLVANRGTLRAAITAANTNPAVDNCIAGSVSVRDIIDLTGLPSNSTITLSDVQLPAVTSSISLNGLGRDDLTISGSNDSAIIHVSGGEGYGSGDLIASNSIATSDQLNVPLNKTIGPLTENGGQTLTHSLPVDSSALNSDDNANCLPTDQRSVPRDNGACDLGAVEGQLDDETFFVGSLPSGKAVIFNLQIRTDTGAGL